jgi:hypothetical protein
VSATATWSTKAAPAGVVGGSVALVLGMLSIVHAAVTLALGGAAWNFPALACMALAAVLAALRVRRLLRNTACTLQWDPSRGFHVSGVATDLRLERVWRGPAWLTLGLRTADADGGAIIRHVIWKSAMPAPLWSELALRIQSEAAREDPHPPQNKDNR